jgi:hypothetical protein
LVGQLGDLDRKGEPVGRVARPPHGVVLREQAGGQGRPVAGPQRRRDRRVGEPGRAGHVRAVPGQLPRQAGQHASPQGRVLLAEGDARLLQRQQQLAGQGRPAPGADGVQAEGCPRQPLRVHGSPGEFRRPPAGAPAGGEVAGAAVGGGQLQQQLDPARRLRPRRPVERLQRPRQVLRGLRMGEPPRRLGRRQGGVADGRVLGAGACQGEVVGELCRRDPAGGVALGLEGLADLQVQPCPRLGAEPLVDRLAEQVVGEAVGPQRPGRSRQDVRPHGLVEQVTHLVGGTAGDPDEQCRAELRPRHRGGGDHLGAGPAQPGKAPLDRLADAERYPGLAGRLQPVGGAGLGQQPGDLLDEERVAAGPPPDVGDQRGRWRRAKDAGQHQRDLLLGQPRQR